MKKECGMMKDEFEISNLKFEIRSSVSFIIHHSSLIISSSILSILSIHVNYSLCARIPCDEI